MVKRRIAARFRRSRSHLAVPLPGPAAAPERNFTVLSWLRLATDGDVDGADVIIGHDTMTLRPHRQSPGLTPPDEAVYAVDRLAQVDAAYDEIQLLFVQADYVLDMVWLRCRNADDSSELLAVIVERWEQMTRQTFPATWRQTHPRGHFAQP